MTIEKKLTITDFKEGSKAPCGENQTQVVNGIRTYTQPNNYRSLEELGVKSGPSAQLPRDLGNTR